MPAPKPKTTPKTTPKTWFSITNKTADVAEVAIYDEISNWGINAKDFCKELSQITAKTITLSINSPGGQVFDGFAIYGALKEHKAKVNVRIHGLAASIASVIALAGDTITMAPNAYFMIHDPSSYAFGNATDLRKEAELLDKLRDSIASVYAGKTGKAVDEIKKKMAEETWFDGADAKAFGLCDVVTEDGDDEDGEETDLATSLAKFALNATKMPDRLKRVAAKLTDRTITPPQTETPMAAKIIVRDGKQFVNINGTEHEVEGTAPAAPAQPSNAAPATFTAQDLEKAKTDATKAEREYSAEFETAITASGMDAAKALQFRKDFYGRPMSDVKWLASNAIGTRATAAGEGASDQPAGEKGKGKDENPEDTVRTNATKRFETDQNVRNLFGARYAAPGTDQFKASLARYIDAELRMHHDSQPANRAKLISGATK